MPAPMTTRSGFSMKVLGPTWGEDIGVLLVEGYRPGCNAQVAELELPIEEANRQAIELGIPVRFREEVDQPKQKEEPVYTDANFACTIQSQIAHTGKFRWRTGTPKRLLGAGGYLPKGCSTQETVGRSAPEQRDLKGDPHHVIVGESPGDLLRLQPG